MQLPGNSRNLLRDAIRKHPRFVPGNLKVNSLTRQELLNEAALLDIDVQAIVDQAKAAMPAGGFSHGAADLSEDKDEDETQDAAPAEDVAAEATKLRKELSTAMIEGDFDAVTARIGNLLADARKAPVIITKTEQVYVDAPGVGVRTVTAAPVAVPAPVSSASWANLFGITGANGARKINLFAATAATPRIDDKYRFPGDVTVAALAAMGRGRNVWMYGPAGTGKSSFWEQLAARTGRPFVLIPCDDTTEAPELVGMTVPHQGGVRWQDGVLTAAMRTPHAIVLIDEPTVARAGAVMVLQSVLASGVLSIKETGEVVRCAEGVRFAVADNTNGTGGGAAQGYEGTRRMNRATLDRFASFLRVDYMAPADEAAALVAHTACTPQLAEMLVECASLTRKARVTHALGLRRLIAWAEALTDGLEPRMAFEFAILNACARDDMEPIEQACALGLDKKAIGRALKGLAPNLATPAPAAGPTADFAG